MGKLPLKIRLDVRDQWENADSPVQKSISELSDLIGLPVNISLETSLLWAELQKYFPDQTNFIPSLVDLIKIWVSCPTSKLEEDSNAQWTDRLLDEIKDGGQILKAQLRPRPGARTGTTWERAASTFTIFCPQFSPPYEGPQVYFTSDFNQLFCPTSSEIEIPMISSAGETKNIVVKRYSGKDVSQGRSKNALSPPTKSLPSLDALQRPDVLFPRQAPYHMTVRSGRTTITVQGSHQPSLELLANYLKKWINTRMVDFRKIPALQVDLQESYFGFGTFFDSFIIKPVDERQTILNVNPILVIAFIEGILGYELIPQGMGTGEWYFRRVNNFE